MNQLAAFEAYLECAVRSSSDWNDMEGGNPVPLDKNYSIDDFSEEAKQELGGYFVDFCQYVDDLIEQLPDWYTAEQFGHDFWLNRNGHGAGFWDRGLGTLGDKLSEAAKTYGECNLYVADGKIEVG